MPTAADLNKLKVEELQKLLKEKGLPTTGKKADLVQVLEPRQGPRARNARESGCYCFAAASLPTQAGGMLPHDSSPMMSRGSLRQRPRRVLPLRPLEPQQQVPKLQRQLTRSRWVQISEIQKC
jgi:hypothetical protein